MSLRWKNILYTLGLLSAMFLVFQYRENKDKETAQALKQRLIAVTGKTMGPITYNVKYFDPKERNLKTSIDSVLTVFNQSLNTYIPSSEISQFNKEQNFTFNLPYFFEALDVSKNMFDLTDGVFDPSIGPLINAWGFGPGQGFIPDSAYIDSVKQFIGYEKIIFDSLHVSKSDPRVNISFSASAKGYGVDVVAELLESRGIANYFVEIGGEVRTKGKNTSSNQDWLIGVLHPDSEEINPFKYAIIRLTDKAMATSGNYFNYHIVDGVKYGHTIDPKSGYPIKHNLLSATVVAKTCHEADALATAFMVMGKDKAIEFLNAHNEYGGFLIYSTSSGKLESYSTESLKPLIETIDE